MATTNLQMSPQVEQIHGQIRDHFRALAYMNSLGNKKLELFDLGAGASEPIAEDDVHLASGKCSFGLSSRTVKSRTYQCWDEDNDQA
ncbi:novel plant SNARE 13-like [Lotus japonicus]|uniref:novel plant SNARE 13-like n=1 Tax=Lotus japonicus TaxID=34305 RepID=UPI00258B7082|nr:novel plant SNARE 13-like [Lotus japonicus]